MRVEAGARLHDERDARRQRFARGGDAREVVEPVNVHEVVAAIVVFSVVTREGAKPNRLATGDTWWNTCVTPSRTTGTLSGTSSRPSGSLSVVTSVVSTP